MLVSYPGYSYHFMAETESRLDIIVLRLHMSMSMTWWMPRLPSASERNKYCVELYLGCGFPLDASNHAYSYHFQCSNVNWKWKADWDNAKIAHDMVAHISLCQRKGIVLSLLLCKYFRNS